MHIVSCLAHILNLRRGREGFIFLHRGDLKTLFFHRRRKKFCLHRRHQLFDALKAVLGGSHINHQIFRTEDTFCQLLQLFNQRTLAGVKILGELLKHTVAGQAVHKL